MALYPGRVKPDGHRATTTNLDGIADFNGRLINPPFLFGSGGIELLGKEMTTELETAGHQAGHMYMFFTTCPKCAKHYGKNYVVAVAELAEPAQRANAA